MHLVLGYDSQYKQNDQSPFREWCLLDESKQVILQGSNDFPAKIAEATQDYSFTTTVLLMGPNVVVTKIPRPAGSLSKIRQALPFLLEEQVVSDIEDLHFTIVNQTDQSNLVVSIIDRKILQDCVDALTAVNIIPETVLPVWLALPEIKANEWRVIKNNDYVWARTAKFSGFTIEVVQAADILSSLYALQPPLSIEWIAADKIEESWLAVCAEKSIITSIIKINPPDNWITYVAKSMPMHLEINLLHGEFSIKQQIMAQKRWWKWAAVLSAAIFGIWFLGLIGQYLYLSVRTYQINQQIDAAFQEIFPGTKLVGNPRTLVDRELTRIANGEGGTDFLSLLLRVGDILQQFPQVHVAEIVYANNQLELAITTDNFSRLRQLDEEITNQGLPLQQENATSTGGIVSARLMIG